VRRTLCYGLAGCLAALLLSVYSSLDLGRILTHPESTVLDVPADPSAVRLLAGLDPGQLVLGAMSWDLDRDGDLDVVGSTPEEPFAVWINDGAGHFTHQRPVQRQSLAAPSGGFEPSADTGTLIAPPTPKWSSAMPGVRTVARSDLSSDDVLLASTGDPITAVVAHRPARAPPLPLLS
jgi:hypothetical protein